MIETACSIHRCHCDCYIHHSSLSHSLFLWYRIIYSLLVSDSTGILTDEIIRNGYLIFPSKIMRRKRRFVFLHRWRGKTEKKTQSTRHTRIIGKKRQGMYSLGCIEYESGNMRWDIRHWTIAASSGSHNAVYDLLVAFNRGSVTRDEIDSTLTAYNISCVELRSEARDAVIRLSIDRWLAYLKWDPVAWRWMVLPQHCCGKMSE